MVERDGIYKCEVSGIPIPSLHMYIQPYIIMVIRYTCHSGVSSVMVSVCVCLRGGGGGWRDYKGYIMIRICVAGNIIDYYWVIIIYTCK